MLIHFGLDGLRAEWPASLVVIGTFDGVHLGHQAVIRRAVLAAAERSLPCVLATFDRHPAAVLRPDRVPPALSTLGRNLAEFERLGVAATVVLPFNAWLSRLTADRFLTDVLRGDLRAERLVVGHDFAMGSNREGDSDWLRARIPTEVVAAFEIAGVRVSSSAIRAAIAAGEVGRAGEWLGRPPLIEGIVVSGRRLGRELGFPTANLARSAPVVLPADGVYAVRADSPAFEGREYAGALGIGSRPTVGEGLERTIETYLLDYPGADLYGHPLALHVERRIRGDRRFDSLDDLAAGIAEDVRRVRTHLDSTTRPA